MAAIAVGANAANRTLLNIGVSGDGDTASIGLGHFLHMVRRNTPHHLPHREQRLLRPHQGPVLGDGRQGHRSRRAAPSTRCRRSTAARSPSRWAAATSARSFSGDAKQMLALLKGAIAHRGTAVLDIVSPCVTFNNHEGSTKSYPYAKEHEDPLHELGFVPFFEEIQVDYDPGTTKLVELHDGSKITLKKLGHDYDPTNRTQALDLLHKANVEQLFLTGLVYYDKKSVAMDEQLGVVSEPLATLPASKLRPSDEMLAKIMQRYA